MQSALEHPVITRLRSYGYEYTEPEATYCLECGRRIEPEDFAVWGEDFCWRCWSGEEEEDGEEMES